MALFSIIHSNKVQVTRVPTTLAQEFTELVTDQLLRIAGESYSIALETLLMSYLVKKTVMNISKVLQSRKAKSGLQYVFDIHG